MLLFFLHIAPHLSHKTSNDLRAVVLLLSLRSLRCYVRYLKYSMQKLRGARLRFYSLYVVVVGLVVDLRSTLPLAGGEDGDNGECFA